WERLQIRSGRGAVGLASGRVRVARVRLRGARGRADETGCAEGGPADVLQGDRSRRERDGSLLQTFERHGQREVEIPRREFAKAVRVRSQAGRGSGAPTEPGRQGVSGNGCRRDDGARAKEIEGRRT